MSVKSEVLNILENNKGNSVSGQDLAEILSVSRTAIWKAINSLKEEGYIIEATSNKGYSLSTTSDVLYEEGIKQFLNKEFKNNEIFVYKTIDSTNTEAKRKALEGAAHGTVIISEEQTSGRGRLGRDFFSPPQSGIYLSIILKPKLNIANSILITTAASTAVCSAIDEFTDIKPQIKWVNDIYIGDKKVCGILTEAVTDFESGNIESIVLGIGLNVKTDENDFPEDLRNIASSVFKTNESFSNRNKLAAEIINNILNMFETLENREFLKMYKERSFVIGRNIKYKRNNEWTEAFAKDIDDNGGLVVVLNDGQIDVLNSGEISVRRL